MRGQSSDVIATDASDHRPDLTNTTLCIFSLIKTVLISMEALRKKCLLPRYLHQCVISLWMVIKFSNWALVGNVHFIELC